MDFSNMTNLKDLFTAGGPILVILLLLSVFSISIIIERFFKLRSAINLSRQLIAFCKHPIRSENYQKIIDTCRKERLKNVPAATLLKRLVEERTRSQAELKDLSDTVIDWEISKLQHRLTVLGTLGSITPFIGLFGTVIGVMHAFKDLASNAAANAGAATVAAGIAEALINTAAGLFVAIPAVIAYNYFLSKTNYFAKELENVSNEFIYQKHEEKF